MRLTIPAILTAATLALALAPSAAQADRGRRWLKAEGDRQKKSLRNEIDRQEDALDDWRDRQKDRVRAAYHAAKFHGGMSSAEFRDRMRQIDRTYRQQRDRLDDYGDRRRDQLDDHFDRLEDERDVGRRGHPRCFGGVVHIDLGERRRGRDAW